MAKDEEQILSQPTEDEQREYLSAMNNDATEVPIVGSDKKYKVHTFRSAMHNKMKLMRKKDFIFQARLIRYITQIGNNEIFNKKPIRF